VYSYYTNRSLPFLLRDAAHAFTTEGVAEYFGALSRDADWMKANLGISEEDAGRIRPQGRRMTRAQKLVFARWDMVMTAFERALYENPDQDLNGLWWDLVEKYQEVRRPEGRNAPDYAAKIHIIIAPVYYHNYMLGQLFAAQVHAALVRQVFGGEDPVHVIYSSDAQAGRFMQEKVFAPGRSLPWNELTKHATGEPLNPKALAVELQAK
jgi:peptidyl-dipeptidase A